MVAARHLTEWQERTALPDAGWLARNQLAQRIAVSELDWDGVDLDPGVRRLGARIWARRRDLLAELAYAPQADSHGDFHSGQIRAVGEDTVALDWGTYGIAPAGADHAHLALSIVADLSTVVPDPGRPGYRITLLLTGASRAHWMASRGIALPPGYTDLLSAFV
jgi:hypothetical protein